MNSIGGDKELAQAWYEDQILPFDIVLAAANEYGAMAAAKIIGVEILNSGTGISIDDAVSENSATFVARGVEPLAAVASPFQGAIGGESLPTGIAKKLGFHVSPADVQASNPLPLSAVKSG